MREYQQIYLDNLRRIIALSDTGLAEAAPADGAAFLAQRRAESEAIRAIVAENTAMLRRHLFPLLDDIVSADAGEIVHLEEFAQALGGQGAGHLDLVLHYSVHCALLTYARKWGKREMLIRELYQVGLALFYMQEIINRSGKTRYRWKMGLMFGEAAAYIKQYDEITDPDTRGYIHRSMGNLSLAYGGANLEDARKKLHAVRRSLLILTDPAYHAKTPSLPWERYIYTSHQERSSALNALRAGAGDAVLIREVMESAEYVREHQEEDCRRRGVKPMVRWRMAYEAAQYHCGVRSLGDLLRCLEEVYLERDESDYSEDGIYHNISIPALYADYLSHSGKFRLKKREVVSHMYRRVAHYVRHAPEAQAGELMLKYLLVFLRSFVEYPDGIQEKDFLMQLVVGRNPDAYVRALLVAELTERMAALALERRPALLLGVLDCGTAEALRDRREAILCFAHESGLLHDVGMLAFNSMERRMGRSWLEEEREMYQYHVYVGEAILARSESTRPYAMSALGHHRFYDGSGGYPAEYDRAANRDQAVTDLVSAASYLVWLTDDTARQNRRQLPLAEALAEIRAAAGTRLSPDAAALLTELEPELAPWLDQARIRACEAALRQM